MLNLTPYVWLFFSGAIALTLEALWTRYFQLLLGNTVYSFSWVTGSFLLGVSLGSFFGGLIVKKILLEKENKTSSLLKYYLFSEVAVLTTGVLSFSILTFPPDFLIEVLNPKHFFKDGIVSLLFILPTTISMGVGFPLITQRFGKFFEIEKLYASNTIGGGLGLLVLAFFGVISCGYIGLLIIVFVLNLLLIGHITTILKKNLLEEAMIPVEIEEPVAENDLKKLYLLSFLSGFILLGLEAVWFRTSELILNDRAYISTLVLFIVLTLLGLSSFLAPRLKKKWPNFLPYFLFIGLLCLLGAEFLSDQAFLIARDYPRITPQKVAYLLLVFIFPLFLFSFIFPSILMEEKWSGRRVAKLFFANTIGGLVGTLLVSYFLIETFGMKSFYFITFIFIPLFSLLNNKKSNHHFPPFLFIIPLIIFIIIFNRHLYIHQKSQVLVSQELPQGLFSLVKNNKGRLEMYNGNYRIVAPFKIKNGVYAQKALCFFPALYHKSPKKILTMGTGYGISISSFLKLNPDQIDSVEVFPMVNQVSHYFKDLNNEWYLNPKVRIFIDDARGFLSRSKDKYDIISTNIASPYTTSGSLFLTKEYFQTVLEHLNDFGVYSQMVWGPHLPEIIHTFKEVFPYIKAIPGYEKTDLIIIGSKKPLKLKKNINRYDPYWPQYKNGFSRQDSLNLGEKLLNLELEKKSQFIISDHSAVLTHNFSRGLHFFWIHN